MYLVHTCRNRLRKKAQMPPLLSFKSTAVAAGGCRCPYDNPAVKALAQYVGDLGLVLFPAGGV